MGVSKRGPKSCCPVGLSGLNMEWGRFLKQVESQWRGISHHRPGTVGRKRETGLGWKLDSRASSTSKRRSRANLTSVVFLPAIHRVLMALSHRT